jgi:hypothetical protein
MSDYITALVPTIATTKVWEVAEVTQVTSIVANQKILPPRITTCTFSYNFHTAWINVNCRGSKSPQVKAESLKLQHALAKNTATPGYCMFCPQSRATQVTALPSLGT